ncbi:hypothetical protein [Paraflavitalea sp. CAU 1676]|uniref:hypothetical protein n=1 Tax=Paraflavitalea sp. CAU 1676 TaxID=3032598 RepID=UPI0023DCB6EE|nr:hypothetical protein [Paraflavitalea sp. CAU 1676]MDF2192337.1 hypothetical protein [Paraflavitalea sp. CAU 1676]
MNIDTYIRSGIVEAYVLGVASADERAEFEKLLLQHPPLQQALAEFEIQVETFATNQSVPPPSKTRREYNDFINRMPIPRTNGNGGSSHTSNGSSNFIPAYEVSSTHIRVHKNWRIVVLILFIVAKIALAFLIYFAIKFYEARSEVKQMQHKEEQIQSGRR